MEGQRPGSSLAFPNQNTPPAPTPLPVVCRFVPHDQWFLTHLAPHWKGKDVKHHILAKCLNLTCNPPEPPTQYSMADGEPQRPPSPITFAPDPRARASSPILFASALPKAASALLSSGEDDGEDSWDDDMSVIKSPSDGEYMSDDKGKGRQIDSDDSLDAGVPPHGGGRVLPSKVPPSSGPEPSYQPARFLQKLRPSRASQKRVEDPKAVPQSAHLSFTLIRYSTGQTLEDEYPLSDHNLHPHELLELHLSFCPMRRQSRSDSTIIAATPNFPFPLLAPPPKLTRSKSKRKQARLHELIAAHSIRLIRLPRANPQAYVLPYWEGWVRILRWVSRDADDYLYASHILNMPEPQEKQKFGPGPAQYGTGFQNTWMFGQEAIGEIRESNLDANLALNFGLGGRPKEHRTRDKGASGSKVTTITPGNREHQHHHHSNSYSRFEWRDRWLVVRDGWFFLLRDRSDSRPTHRFPLSLLFMLKDADRLTESIESAKGNRRTTSREPQSSRPKESNGHRPPHPPSKDKDKDKTPAPSILERARSPSPSSTLKGTAPMRSPIQSGYGHGRHTFGRHASKPSLATNEEDPYDEDDEGDRREVRTPTNKRPAQSGQHRHPHAHQHRHMQKPEPSRPRRDLTDPATRSRINRETFIPNSKDEADLMNMKIMCAKFLHPSSSGKGHIPDPFNGLQSERGNNPISKRYTSTGPSLAEVTVAIPTGLVSMGMVGVPEDMKDEKRGKDVKSTDNPKHKSRLHSKGSAPSSLSTDFALPGMSKSLNMTADRRPSLPALMHGGDPLRSTTSIASQTPTLSSAANASSTALSFTSLFKSSKDKEEKKREKEAKKAAKRAERERREQEQDAPDATNSAGSWKLALPKRLNNSKTSTVGTVDEELLIISRHQEEAPYGRNREPPEAGDRRFLQVDSDGGMSSPEPSPVVFREGPVSPDYDNDEEHPRFNLNTFSPTSMSTTSLQHTASVEGVGPHDTAKEDSDGASDSISISSPVFAREGGSEEDDEASELDYDIGLKQRRTGYRYGGYHRGEGSSKPSLVAHASQPSLDALSTSTAVSSATVTSATLTAQSSTQASIAGKDKLARTDSQRHRARFESKTRADKRKVQRKGEWIIMDFGNDAAFHSLLRILHRHSEEMMFSSFVPITRLRETEPQPPVPMSPRLPPDLPSPLPKDPGQGKPLPPSPKGVTATSSPVSSVRSRSQSDAPFNPPPRLARGGLYSDDENDARSISMSSYQHPKPLYPQPHKSSNPPDEVSGLLNSIPPGIGPYRYPEWRLQAVTRATRAGLGQEGRPLELVHLAMNEAHSEFYRYNDPAFPRPLNPFREERSQALEESPTSANVVPADEPGEKEQDDEPRQDDPIDSDDYEDDDEDDVHLVFTSESEHSDESELEWQTWSADLPRQRHVHRRRGPPLWNIPSDFAPFDTDMDYVDDDESDAGVPTTLQAENPTILKQRRMREPCGVVTSMFTSTALPGFVARDTEHHDNEEHRTFHRVQRYPASGTLSSPSSSESLAARNQQPTRPQTGNSIASSTASSPHSSQAHSRGHSHSISHTLPHKSSRSSTRHSLLHSSSMQTSLRGANEAAQGPPQDNAMRKVSMPVMGSTTTTTVTEQTFTLNQNSFGMAIQELHSQDNGSAHSHQVPMSSSYGSSSFRDLNVEGSASGSNDPFLSTDSPIGQHRAPSNASLASGSQHHLRHQSSNFSVGRASMNSSRPSVLRKNPSDRDIETVRRPPPPNSSTPASPKTSPRPKLTVATSHQPVDGFNPQFSPRSVSGDPGGSGGRSLGRASLRHMKSASSLVSAHGNGEEGNGGAEAKAKKKKSNTFGIFSAF